MHYRRENEDSDILYSNIISLMTVYYDDYLVSSVFLLFGVGVGGPKSLSFYIIFIYSPHQLSLWNIFKFLLVPLEDWVIYFLYIYLMFCGCLRSSELLFPLYVKRLLMNECIEQWLAMERAFAMTTTQGADRTSY